MWERKNYQRTKVPKNQTIGGPKTFRKILDYLFRGWVPLSSIVEVKDVEMTEEKKEETKKDEEKKDDEKKEEEKIDEPKKEEEEKKEDTKMETDTKQNLYKICSGILGI